MQNESQQSPQTITMTNTNKKLDYHNKIVNVFESDYNDPDSVVWEHKGRYYKTREVCRGMYQSGQKVGQLCWMDVYGSNGLCNRHIGQAGRFIEPEPESDSSDE